jgi:hypothetical protein
MFLARNKNSNLSVYILEGHTEVTKNRCFVG